MSDAHSPTPWHVSRSAEKHPTPDEANYLDIVTIPSGCIADHPGARLICEVDRQDGIDDANAEFVCRAVNAHDALLAVLQYVSEWADKSEDWWINCPDRGGLDAEKIDAAIALAKEGQQ